MGLLSIARAEDEMKEKEEELKKAMENAVANEAKRKDLEAAVTDLMTEKEKLFSDLQAETDRLIEALEKLEGEEHSTKLFQERNAKSEKEVEQLTQKGEELRENISKLETEKTSLNKQIDGLNEDILKQDEAI